MPPESDAIGEAGEAVLTLKSEISAAPRLRMDLPSSQVALPPAFFTSKVRKARFSVTVMRGAQALASGSSGMKRTLFSRVSARVAP
ncbi:hypothetical protein D3C72_2030090 [compost metagenome]